MSSYAGIGQVLPVGLPSAIRPGTCRPRHHPRCPPNARFRVGSNAATFELVQLANRLGVDRPELAFNSEAVFTIEHHPRVPAQRIEPIDRQRADWAEALRIAHSKLIRLATLQGAIHEQQRRVIQSSFDGSSYHEEEIKP